MIKTGGGDLDFSILASTMRQKSMVPVVRQRLSQISMEKFLEKPPRFGALHWDEKMVKDGRKFWPCSSLVLREEGKLQYETRQTRQWHSTPKL